MDRKTLEVLEFGKIQEMLAFHADTPMGKVLSRNCFPVDVETAKKRQRLGCEIAQVLLRTSSPPLAHVQDVTETLSKAARGTVLTPSDLRNILDVLEVCDKIGAWIRRLGTDFARLRDIETNLPQEPFLKDKLMKTVDEQGEIKDGASEELLRIRRSLRNFQEQLRKRAEQMTKARSIAQYLQEPIVTLRNGRYVLPVRQEYASKIQGIVHDQSASGQTLFLEPSELLEMTNQLKRLELMERDEIARILLEISVWVAESAPSLLDGIKALGQFDLNLAKARLLRKWGGCFPELKNEFRLSLVKAWHPLLKGTPVPFDMCLDETGARTMVVTGPNMGGKTVALKTCGLLTALALSGMPCPCGQETQIGNIEEILCDIGDEQSIEEDLSTFSAHIANVKNILASSRKGSLVIVDELGAGTDPREGAALARAVLKKIHASGALCVVTSHYGELKITAHGTVGMTNASMEWDPDEMVPTFRLIVGRPGRSNAFLVAQKLGLDADVLNCARESMPEDVVRLEDLIGQMEVESQKARKAKEQAEAEKTLYQKLRRKYEDGLQEMGAKERKTLRDARKEAQSIIARARNEFEKALAELKDSRRKSPGEFSTDASRIRRRLSNLGRELSDKTQDPPRGEPLEPQDLKTGMRVHISGFSEPGIVLESSDPKHISVQIGDFKLITDIAKVSTVKGGPEPQKHAVQAGELPGEKSQTVSHEIDLRGLTKEEVFPALDKYLDDALLASLPQVMIIHGKGTGALRKAVEEYLQLNSSCIESYRLGQPPEGGTGVTIAKLKT